MHLAGQLYLVLLNKYFIPKSISYITNKIYISYMHCFAVPVQSTTLKYTTMNIACYIHNFNSISDLDCAKRMH